MCFYKNKTLSYISKNRTCVPGEGFKPSYFRLGNEIIIHYDIRALCGPGGSRTHNLQIRSLLLYPIELRGR